MIQLSYFGHSCFSLSDGQTTLLLDPFFSGNPLATIRAEDMDCDYILVSHAARAKADAENLLQAVQEVNGVQVIVAKADAADMDELRSIADMTCDKLKNGVVVLATAAEDKVNLVVKASGEAVKKGIHGAMGDVRIAIEAIKNLVDKTTRSVHGVRDVKERVTAEVSKSSPVADPVVHIKLRVILGQENNAAAVSDEIQKKIREQLTNFVGLRDVDIEITVENIANTATAKQRVV